MVRTHRRRFLAAGLGLAGLGLLSGCGVLPGQQAGKLRRIGVLFPGAAPASTAPTPLLDVLREALGERGWVEGRSFALEPRYWGDRPEQLSDILAELVGLPVDLVIAAGSAPVVAAKQATDSVPIVFVNVPDPVGLGLVASLAHPVGNVTGLASVPVETSTGKRLELLKELIPGLSRVAALTIPTPASRAAARGAEAPARALNLELRVVEARSVDDVEGPFEAAAREGANGLIEFASSLTLRYPARVAELAARYRLPVIYSQRELVDAGGLTSYGPSFRAMWRDAGTYMDRILRGASPADLPVEQPTTFEFAINLRAAQALGLTVSASVLQRATDVIQ
jgi:putative ABC transport system substrate-binding protein